MNCGLSAVNAKYQFRNTLAPKDQLGKSLVPKFKNRLVSKWTSVENRLVPKNLFENRLVPKYKFERSLE